MNRHLLTRDDLSLIQDYMLTKATLLLSQAADTQEWEFEIQSEERLSEGRWESRNAFLFDYTLARFLSAVNEHQRERGTNEPLPALGPLESFAQDFTDAVARQDSGRAEEIWKAQNLPVAVTGTATSTGSSLALILRLERAVPGVHLREALEHLPAEFEPTQFVS